MQKSKKRPKFSWWSAEAQSESSFGNVQEENENSINYIGLETSVEYICNIEKLSGGVHF